MPRFSARGRSSRYSPGSNLQNIRGSPGNSGNNYRSEQTGTKRHEYIEPINDMASLNLGDYGFIRLLSFARSFDSGNPDVEDTPTASNNYQTARVMNGSAVKGFQAKIKLANQGSSEPVLLDVYSIVTSFSDSLYLNTVYPNEVPIDYGEVANLEGQVNFKGVKVIWAENTYKNFKGLQRNITHLGTITLSSEDGGHPTAEFMINGLPSKVKRSQTGMFYGLLFHYSSTKNTAATVNVISTAEVKFSETPASNRIPYRW